MAQSAADKLMERMRRSASGYSQQDFRTVLVGNGFRFREGKEHTIYQHPSHPELVASIPRHRELKPYLAREVVALIDLLSQLEKE